MERRQTAFHYGSSDPVSSAGSGCPYDGEQRGMALRDLPPGMASPGPIC